MCTIAAFARPRSPRLRCCFLVHLAVILVAGALLAGCSARRQTIDPAERIERAASALERVSSFHFALSHEQGATRIVQGMMLTSAEGDVARPSRMKAELTVRAMGTSLRLQFVSIGDRAWLSNPFNPSEFQTIPGVTAADVLNIEALPQVLRDVREPRFVGEESREGTVLHRIEGTLGTDSLLPLVPNGTEPGHTVTVELWIGKDDDLLRRVVIRGPLLASEPAEVTRTLELSRFDTPVTIEPPA